jgi:hypothetical protein
MGIGLVSRLWPAQRALIQVEDMTGGQPVAKDTAHGLRFSQLQF